MVVAKVVLKLLALALALVLADLSPAPAQDPLESYRIGPGDILEIITWKEQNISRPDILVRPDGRISMPLTDDIRAAGLTPMELKLEVTRALKRYIEEPQVYVIIKDPRSKTFSVLGNVVRPGRYPLLSPTSVLHALSTAGGFNEWAHKNDIVVIRGSGAEQKRFRFVYSEMLSGSDLAQNVDLKPGDVVIVP
jgi:polysaccharide export outer membrane protein